jgi:hypothetical protein
MLGGAGVVASAAPGTLIVDCSTNTPAMVREVAVAAAARGIGHLDAPVSGSVAQARGRELVFMVGGPASDLDRARPLLEAMGRSHTHMGASGAGATIKLINNMLSGTVNAAIAEALLIAQAAGLDPQATQYVLGEGAAGSRLFRTKMPKIYARDFAPARADGKGPALLPRARAGARPARADRGARAQPDAGGAAGRSRRARRVGHLPARGRREASGLKAARRDGHGAAACRLPRVTERRVAQPARRLAAARVAMKSAIIRVGSPLR